jgi:putative Holliday junction resolvase
VKRIAVVAGSVRIGIAVSIDTLALARESISADDSALQRIAEIAQSENADQIIVGHPIGLGGSAGPAATRARAFALSLVQLTDAEVRLLDERLTTASATRKLREAGRDSRQQRAIIDSQAAVELLEFAISLAASNQPVGEKVGGHSE